jgi:hypothetical protein
MANRDGMPILIHGGTTKELAPIELASGAFDEAWIQKLVFDHPATIPIRQIEPGLDHLFQFAASCQLPMAILTI